MSMLLFDVGSFMLKLERVDGYILVSSAAVEDGLAMAFEPQVKYKDDTESYASIGRLVSHLVKDAFAPRGAV